MNIKMAILWIDRKHNYSAINVCTFRFLSRIGIEMVIRKPKQYFKKLLKEGQKLSNLDEILHQYRTTKNKPLNIKFKSIAQLDSIQEHISLRLRLCKNGRIDFKKLNQILFKLTLESMYQMASLK